MDSDKKLIIAYSNENDPDTGIVSGYQAYKNNEGSQSVDRQAYEPPNLQSYDDVMDGGPMVRFLNDLTNFIETGKEINVTCL